MGLEIKLTGNLSLSPRMLLSARILQMSTQELSEHIKRLSEENPALELDANAAAQESYRRLAARFPGAGAGAAYSLYDFDIENMSDPAEENIQDALMSQLQAMPLAPTVAAAAVYIIGNIGDDGLLDQSAESLRRAAGIDPAIFDAALGVVRFMEPAGVGAENLSECLLLQLQRLEKPEPLAECIVRDHLQLLAKNRLETIAKRTGASLGEVEGARAVIRKLSPKPAGSFGGSPRVHATPDCFVTRSDEGSLSIEFVDAFLPSLSISPTYTQMLRQTEDPEVREYLHKKIDEIKLTIYSIQQRKNTILRCIIYIVEHQTAFFEKGPGYLNPLSMAQIAADLNVHISTVSRAIHGKYIQCSFGLFPAKYFLSRKLGDSSADIARRALRALVESEPEKKPYSDQHLAQALQAQGIDISRRTVAKYRHEMNIADSSGRRRR